MSVQDKKAGIFIDIDGTIIDSKTEEPLENAIECINSWYDQGHTVILTTKRGNEFSNTSRFSQISTERLLRNLGIKYHNIIYNIDSPRILINDKGAYVIKHNENESWDKTREKFPNDCITTDYKD